MFAIGKDFTTCIITHFSHPHRTTPAFIYDMIENFDKNDERLRKFCWDGEPACICYLAQIHEELICKSYHK